MRRIEFEWMNAGEQSKCCPNEFVKECHSNLPIFQHTPWEIMQARLHHLFTGQNRWEYRVYDDDRLRAVVLFNVDWDDAHIGQPVMAPIMAVSCEPNLLVGGYRKMIEIAKSAGLEWIMTTRTEDHNITAKFRKIK